jgi:hypothetical protein
MAETVAALADEIAGLISAFHDLYLKILCYRADYIRKRQERVNLYPQWFEISLEEQKNLFKTEALE